MPSMSLLDTYCGSSSAGAAASSEPAWSVGDASVAAGSVAPWSAGLGGAAFQSSWFGS